MTYSSETKQGPAYETVLNVLAGDSSEQVDEPDIR